MYDAGNRGAIRLPLEATHPLVCTLQHAMRRQTVREPWRCFQDGRLPIELGLSKAFLIVQALCMQDH